ncbi:class I SAM-dependent methyltransferase [Thermodesulfobacteriota bacterium]
MNNNKKKENYHDYVIKDGEFIGDFEKMYQSCTDPWHQDSKVFHFKDLSIAILQLHGFNEFSSILDIGCGKGKFTNKIKQLFPGAKVSGLDISDTAIKTAMARYQQIEFITADIRVDHIDYSKFDLIFMTEIMWYVLPNLQDIFREINHGLQVSKGIFILNNHLYQPGEQKYGSEYINDLKSLLNILPFRVEYVMEHNRFVNYDVTLLCKFGKCSKGK